MTQNPQDIMPNSFGNFGFNQPITYQQAAEQRLMSMGFFPGDVDWHTPVRAEERQLKKICNKPVDINNVGPVTISCNECKKLQDLNTQLLDALQAIASHNEDVLRAYCMHNYIPATLNPWPQVVDVARHALQIAKENQ